MISLACVCRCDFVCAIETEESATDWRKKTVTEWFFCVVSLHLHASLVCASLFFSSVLFLWARNCLLDYICFSNWYIVTLCFYSGLLSLHCASFVLPLSLSLSVARASQMSLHANMTYLLEWTWKKCGKTRFHLVNNKSDEIYRKTSTECLFSCVCLYLSTVNK